TFDELDLRLAEVAGFRLAMRTHEYRVELHSLGAERVEDELVRHVERGLRKARAPEAVLVRHHREFVAGTLRLAQRREHAGHEADLVERIHLLIRWFLDQRAIPVHEQDLRHSMLRINRSFCSGVPTEIRREPGATARMSRISSFAPRAAASVASGSAKSTSTKFATLGQRRLTDALPASAALTRSRSATTCATRSRC